MAHPKTSRPEGIPAAGAVDMMCGRAVEIVESFKLETGKSTSCLPSRARIKVFGGMLALRSPTRGLSGLNGSLLFYGYTELLRSGYGNRWIL
jgi:hypothetical protein